MTVNSGAPPSAGSSSSTDSLIPSSAAGTAAEEDPLSSRCDRIVPAVDHHLVHPHPSHHRTAAPGEPHVEPAGEHSRDAVGVSGGDQSQSGLPIGMPDVPV